MLSNNIITKAIDAKIEIALSKIELNKEDEAIKILDTILTDFQGEDLSEYIYLALSILYSINPEYQSKLLSLTDLIKN